MTPFRHRRRDRRRGWSGHRRGRAQRQPARNRDAALVDRRRPDGVNLHRPVLRNLSRDEGGNARSDRGAQVRVGRSSLN